jgi:3-oxoacyl-[acyl-carrier-protein] synthase-1
MKLFLNALGVVTPLGRDKVEVACNLFAGSRSGLVRRDDLIPGRTVHVGTVTCELPSVPERLRHFDCRNNRLALMAGMEMAADIAAAKSRYGAERIAVIMGTSTSGMAEAESALKARLAGQSWPSHLYTRQELGNLGAFVADANGLTGPAYTIATACSSSGKVFASARRLIVAGLCDAALVGGFDTLCQMTLNGFAALEALAPNPCQPFSRNRNGINIGEGGAMFLVSPEPGPVELLGCGESSDAHHVSAPDPEAGGAIRAMSSALQAAGLSPGEIDYINLHGTATPLNDRMEGRAVHAIFGAATPCSSTKALTGHMLGAASAAEAAFLWLSLNDAFSHGKLPPHLWDGEADSEIPPINLIPVGTRLADRARVAMLSSSFAFGGSNVAVILGRGWHG